MTKNPLPSLSRLKGKRLVFEGDFGRGNAYLHYYVTLAELQKGEVLDVLDKDLDFVVTPDPTDRRSSKNCMKPAQAAIKEAAWFNANKGARIQVIDVNAFVELAKLTINDLVAMFHAAQTYRPQLDVVVSDYKRHQFLDVKRHPIVGHRFDDLDLSRLPLDVVQFERCSFVGAALSDTKICWPKQCDFSACKGTGVVIANPSECRFHGVSFVKSQVFPIDHIDFTHAKFESSTLASSAPDVRRPDTVAKACVFVNASLSGSTLKELSLESPDFSGSDLSSAVFADCIFHSPSFKKSNLQDAWLESARLEDADFSGANLKGANLCGANLSGSNFVDADLAGARMEGAKLDGVDLSKAKNVKHAKSNTPLRAKAMTRLDELASETPLQLSFFIRRGSDDEGEEARIDSAFFGYFKGLQLPAGPDSRIPRNLNIKIVSDALKALAKVASQRPVRFETVQARRHLATKFDKELHQIAIEAIAEAFEQEPPPASKLSKVTKAYRQSLKK